MCCRLLMCFRCTLASGNGKDWRRANTCSHTPAPSPCRQERLARVQYGTQYSKQYSTQYSTQYQQHAMLPCPDLPKRRSGGSAQAPANAQQGPAAILTVAPLPALTRRPPFPCEPLDQTAPQLRSRRRGCWMFWMACKSWTRCSRRPPASRPRSAPAPAKAMPPRLTHPKPYEAC
jgi:hypothetical protein